MSDTPELNAADAYETMEALLCEMQGLRDVLVDVKRERDEARLQHRSTEALAMALVRTIDELKTEKSELFVQLVNLQAGSRRATLDEIAESVREKYDPEHEFGGDQNE